MGKNKIALYLPSLRGGGAERMMANLAEGFARRGFHVDLVLAKAEGPYLSQVSDHVNVIDLQSSRVSRSLLGLMRYLKHHEPQVLLSALNHANVVAILASKLAHVNTKMVVSERANVSQSIKNAQLYRAKLTPTLMKWFYPQANYVIAVSQGVADDLVQTLKLSPDKVRAIYNPVIDDDLRLKAEHRVEHPWFQKHQPPVILSVGRLAAQKDYPTLIRAFAIVRKSLKARLMILGEGEKRQELMEFIHEQGLQEDVSLPGFVDNPYAYMKKANVFVLSSRWEGLPSVLIEAMALGTPVISTDCPSGPSEILEDGKWGRLVPVGDVEKLAEAMMATLNDPNPPDVAKRAQDFEVERAVEEYLAVMLGQGNINILEEK